MFRFFLEISSIEYEVNPLRDDKLGLTASREGDNRFLREKLSSTLTFTRKDFDLINNQPFSTKFTLIIKRDNIERFRGVFWKNDCEFDLDAKNVKAKIKEIDQYTELLEGANKKFNLIEIAPELTEITYKKQPVIQVYIGGSDTITNVINQNVFEQKISSPTTDPQTLSDMHFFSGAPISFIFGGGQITPDVSGQYLFQSSITYTRLGFTLSKDVSTDTWTISDSNGTLYNGTAGVGELNDTIFTSVTTGDTTQAYNFQPFARFLTDAETVNGNPTFEIIEDDIAGQNAYSRAAGQSITSVLSLFETNTDTPTEFGKFPVSALFFPNKYYEVQSLTLAPVSKSTWFNVAIWGQINLLYSQIQEEAATDVTLRYCYQLSDAISALLEQIAPDISHESTSEYSQFFYGSNTIRGTFRAPIIIPKTNVSIGEFDQPATIADIQFQDIISLIRNAYNCDYYIEDNKFKIEHAEFFRNGGSYISQEIVTDLTADIEHKTGKKWSFGTNKYSYKKETLPERLEFVWMEKVSRFFEGYPIEVLDEFADKGNIKKISIPNFNGDLDFVIANGTDVSKEGFVLVECLNEGSGYYTPLIDIILPTFQVVKLQNGYLSFIYLHNAFWRHDMPAFDLRINNGTTTAVTTKRTKEQTLDFAGNDDLSIGLITTGLGTGEIDKYEYEFTSKIYRATILHDTE